jgi:hypothetical protein
MPSTGSIEEFATSFRAEHRHIRDAILDLIAAARSGDRIGAQRLVARLAELTGPHFRYEEERLYPALVGFYGPEYVESLCTEHDAAIESARGLAELVERDDQSLSDRERIVTLARGLLPHVSDCEGLSIMVERLPEAEVAGILRARRRARRDDLGLLRWADTTRAARDEAGAPGDDARTPR